MTALAPPPPRGLLGTLQERWQRRSRSWLQHRIPPARHLQLDHRTIFILPHRQSLGFLLMLGLMFVGAINYESNLAFALVFLLLGMFLVSLLHTFRNLSGLQVTAVAGPAVFAGDSAEFSIILSRSGERSHDGLLLSFQDCSTVSCDLVHEAEQRVALLVPAPRRGWLDPGRLRIETVFPFGLCRAWSLPDLQLRCLVYPRPLACDLTQLLAASSRDGHTLPRQGSDDFHGLREYRSGDPLRHVAWKNLARGQGMLVKEYASPVDREVRLHWEQFAGMEVEERLSRLCWCVLRLAEADVEFGLELPGTVLPPARGAEHCRQALEALARHGCAEDAA